MTTSKKVAAVIAGAAIAFLGLVAAPADALEPTPASGGAPVPGEPAQATLKAKAPKVSTREIKGTMITGAFLPTSFKYSIKAPTLTGVAAKVKKAFDQRVDELVSAELAYYAKGAITEKAFDDLLAEAAGAVSRSDYLTGCGTTFKTLKGSFASSVYKGRYASTVLTFKGVNAPCGQLGGLWVGYQTDRSVTIDTKTGKFLGLTAFTSNSKGKVNAALKKWYRSISHLFLSKQPKASAGLKVCDRPGNTITVSPIQKPCFREPFRKTGLVAWRVADAGVRVTFPASDGPTHVLLTWKQIPRRR